MNSNQEEPGRNSLIIVISLHFFFFFLPDGTEGYRNPRELITVHRDAKKFVK